MAPHATHYPLLHCNTLLLSSPFLYYASPHYTTLCRSVATPITPHYPTPHRTILHHTTLSYATPHYPTAHHTHHHTHHHTTPTTTPHHATRRPTTPHNTLGASNVKRMSAQPRASTKGSVNDTCGFDAPPGALRLRLRLRLRAPPRGAAAAAEVPDAPLRVRRRASDSTKRQIRGDTGIVTQCVQHNVASCAATERRAACEHGGVSM